MNGGDLAAIRARIDAATPGPWLTHEMGGKVWVGNQADGRKHGLWDIVYATDYLTDCTQEAAGRYRADADLIANAPADLAALLAEVERLTAERDQLMRDTFTAYETSGADTDGDKQWHTTPEGAGRALIDGVTSLRNAYDELVDQWEPDADALIAERDAARAALAALLADVETLRDRYVATRWVETPSDPFAAVIARHTPKEADR